MSWQRTPVEGSLLAYRGRTGQGSVWMGLSSRCGISLAEPRFLARHLRIDLPPHRVVEGEAVQLGERTGWRQRLEVEGAAPVQVETVTFTAEGCALDWTLTLGAGADAEPARRDFEAWWRSWAPPDPADEGVP